MNDLIIDIDKLNVLINRLKVINHPDRISIIELLHKKGKVSVSEIQTYLNLDFGAASIHLRLLKAQQILIQKREWKFKMYSINYSVMDRIIDCVNYWK